MTDREATKQEPVAWGMRDMNGNIYDCISVQEHARIEGDYNVPLYTTPQRREWVGLTEDEIDECYYWKDRQWTTDELVRHVEAKLKEKNA